MMEEEEEEKENADKEMAWVGVKDAESQQQSPGCVVPLPCLFS